MASTAFAVACLLAIGVASVGATWCHKSAYSFTAPKPACSNLMNATATLFKACGITAIKVAGASNVPVAVPAKTIYFYQVGCQTGTCDFIFMNVAKDKATWTAYDTCKHSQKLYLNTFDGHSNSACKLDAMCPAPWCHLSGYSYAAAPACPTLLATKKALYASCGLVAKPVTGPTMVPSIIAAKTLYYYQQACTGTCAPNSWQIMQIVKDQATYAAFSTCEGKQASYNTTFAGKGVTACKSDSMCML